MVLPLMRDSTIWSDCSERRTTAGRPGVAHCVGGRVRRRSASVKPLVPRGRALRVDGHLGGAAAHTGESRRPGGPPPREEHLMSAEIVPGVDTMALAAKAWHGYGTVVGRYMTYAQALTTAGLDWTAAMAPLTAITASGVVEVDTHRATYRSDTGDVLGVVGADYEPHQPAELLELARLTLDAASDDGHVEVLGSLRGGRTVFVTIALPNDIDIAGDVHMPRLVWVTSMDGTIATRAVSTYVRAVCANTIRASFRQA